MNNNSVQAGTIFITGISASGKSTMGKRLRDNMVKNGINNVMLLDGEDIRGQLEKRGKHYGYSDDDRTTVALQIARLALEYNQKGIICIICSICHIRKIREEMRSIIENVMEVHLDCSVDICAKRDYKGNYSKAFRGLYDNFVGVTEPYQESGHVELNLHTGIDSIEECSRILFEAVSLFLEGLRKKAYERVGIV